MASSYPQATAELALARRNLPNEAQIPALTGYLLRRQGQWGESVRNMERALRLDPRDFVTLQQLGSSYQLTHRYADAERTFQRALTIKPGTHTPACCWQTGRSKRGRT